MLFTAEELAELGSGDAVIDAEFQLDTNDMLLSKELDRAAHLDSLPYDKRIVAAQKKAYREANREKVAAQQ